MFNKDGHVEGMDRSGPKPGGYYESVSACHRAGTEPRPRVHDQRTGLTVLTPCHECPKVPADAPEKSWRYAIEPSDKSFLAIKFHDECDAVGDWPKNPEGNVDGIVKRNAALIKTIREVCRRAQSIMAFGSMLKVI